MKPTQTKTPAEGSVRKRSLGPTILVVFSIGLCAVLAEIAMVSLGFGSVTVRNALVTAASFSGAAIALLTAASRPGAPAPPGFCSASGFSATHSALCSSSSSSRP